MARLPEPGGDQGTWGDVLNEYLLVSHNPDGTIKPSVVDTASLQNAAVTASKLYAGTGTNNHVLVLDSAAPGGFKWASLDSVGPLTMGGALSGTTANAQITAGAIGDTELADGIITPAKLNSDTPVTGELLSYNGTDFEWVTPPAASGSGEANTATNIGTGGIGVYKQKTGVNLELKSLRSTSSKLSMVNNTANNTIDFDVAEANLNLANISGSLPQASVTGLTTSLSGKVNTSAVGAANGVASLDGTGKVPSVQLPTAVGENNTASNVGTAGVGVFKQKTGVNLELKNIAPASSKVTVVNNSTNNTVDLDVNTASLGLTKADVGLANVDNTSDANKPVSTATQTALNGKANTVHTHTTTDLTNFTEATQDIIGTSLVAGTNVTIAYDDPSGNTTISATPGAGVTDLTTSRTATDVTVISSTGLDATLAAADASNAGVMSAADKTKLSGIATGATANSSDATLLARANHTGTQTSSTISDFTEASQDVIGSTLVAGTNMTVSYNDAAGTVTLTASGGSSDATTSSKGIVQLAGDLAGTAASPTVPGLAAKAADSAVVHNTGTETVAGVKTFSSSPIVPTPTTGTQAANKTYVDGITAPVTSVASKTGAVTLVKADVGLGNVDNTSDASKPVSTATQTALDAKASETVTVTGATSLTGGGDLTANRTLSLVNDSATPGNSRYYGTNSSGTKGWFALSGGGASVGYEHIFLDDMAGATDDDKLTAAIAQQQATAGMPPIVLAARNHSFNQTRNLYSGLKLIGQSTGPKNLEQDPDFVTSRITLGAAVSSGTSSWWVTPGGNLFDIYMADFAVQGNSGSSVHQFIDVTTGSLYACEFHSLAFNFMRSVFGRKDRKCLCTQVLFTGHWTANNLWDTQFFIGGSDNQFWMGGMINIGPSASPAQTGTYADGDYEIMFDTLSKTDIGYIYLTALNGWRGIKVTGSGFGSISFFGGTYEGYNGSTNRAPGTVIRLEGGSGAFYGPHIGQAMMSPDAAEGGYVHMTGGEWSFYAPQFYRGSTADTVPAIYQTGGRLHVTGATRGNQSETWSPRPVLETGAAGGNAAGTGSYTTYCPDLSMSVT